MGPLQYRQVSIERGIFTGALTPVTALLSCPLEHSQMASCCCFSACLMP